MCAPQCFHYIGAIASTRRSAPTHRVRGARCGRRLHRSACSEPPYRAGRERRRESRRPRAPALIPPGEPALGKTVHQEHQGAVRGPMAAQCSRTSPAFTSKCSTPSSCTASTLQATSGSWRVRSRRGRSAAARVHEAVIRSGGRHRQQAPVHRGRFVAQGVERPPIVVRCAADLRAQVVQSCSCSFHAAPPAASSARPGPGFRLGTLYRCAGAAWRPARAASAACVASASSTRCRAAAPPPPLARQGMGAAARAPRADHRRARRRLRQRPVERLFLHQLHVARSAPGGTRTSTISSPGRSTFSRVTSTLGTDEEILDGTARSPDGPSQQQRRSSR